MGIACKWLKVAGLMKKLGFGLLLLLLILAIEEYFYLQLSILEKYKC